MFKFAICIHSFLLFASLAHAISNENTLNQRDLHSSIHCLYSGLDFEQTNILRELYFFQQGTTDLYKAEERYYGDIEFNGNKYEVLNSWIARLVRLSDKSLVLNPTDSNKDALRLDIYKRKTEYGFPDSRKTNITVVGKMKKYNYFYFRCEGGPVPN